MVYVNLNASGKRLDKALEEQLSAYSRSEISTWIKSGLVRLDGQQLKPAYKVTESVTVSVDIPAQEHSADIIRPENIPLNIIYEDEDILVIDKAAGMLVHPDDKTKTGTLVNALLYYTKGNLATSGGWERAGVVHRLDKDTAGVLVAAKTEQALENLQEQFKNRQVKKIYEAIVHDRINEQNIKIDLPLARNPRDRHKMAVVENGKEAITYVELKENLNNAAYIKLDIITGRTHQIRVHMQYIKHPVIGDKIYGRKSDKAAGQELCLYAQEISFKHPVTGIELTFKAKMPAYFAKTLADLGSSCGM